MKLGSASFRRFLVDMIPLPAVQRLKKVVDVMDETANRVFTQKKEMVSRLLKEEEEEDEDAVKELRDVISLTREFSLCRYYGWTSRSIDHGLVASNMRNPRLTDEELVAQMRSVSLPLLSFHFRCLSFVLPTLTRHVNGKSTAAP